MLDYMKLKIQSCAINRRILEAKITLETLIQPLILQMWKQRCRADKSFVQAKTVGKI